MELSELTAYAEEKHHIREQHKWSDFPGFSVLTDPATGKWAALLMRQWDTETGTEIERCDIKCGQQTLSELHVPYLTMPFRMKGMKWIGVRFDHTTEPEVIFRLFERALHAGEQRGYTIVLDNQPTQRTVVSPYHTETKQPAPVSPYHAETKQPAASTYYAKTVQPAGLFTYRMEAAAPASGTPRYTDTAIPSFGDRPERTDPDVPEKIREMMRLYEQGDGSLSHKTRNFIRQGKFMEDYEDDAPWSTRFRHFFPTYHDLSAQQLRGYFSWRALARKGDFRPVATSLAFIYIYELLNGIGTASPEDGLQKLKEFEKGFVEAGIGEESIRHNLKRWMREYAIVSGVSEELARSCFESEMLAQDRALQVLKNPEDAEDETLFDALAAFAGDKLAKSPVILKDETEGKHLFAAVWRYTARHFERDGRTLFDACFGKMRVFPWYPLGNAVWSGETPAENTQFVLDESRTYRFIKGRWTEERFDSLYFDRKLLQAMIHETDRLLRRYKKTGHYLREKAGEEWVTPYVEAVLEEEKKAAIEAARPKIVIDFSGLEKIRQDAIITRDSLLTEEELTAEDQLTAAMDKTASDDVSAGVDEPVADGIPAGVDEAVADDVLRGVDEPVADGISAGVDEPGADGISAKADKPAVNGLPAQNDDSVVEAGAPDLQETASRLQLPDILHLQILQELLSGGPGPALALIRQHHLMVSVVADTINEALYDEIGDNILECDGETLAIVEDYVEDIREILEGESG